MRQYNFSKAITYAFFSPALYRDVARQWKGWGGKFLLGALSLFTALAIFINISAIHQLLDTKAMAKSLYARFFENASVPPVTQINRLLHTLGSWPAMKMQESGLSIEETLPYTIKDPVSGDPLVMFTATAPASLEKFPVPLWVTPQAVYYQENTALPPSAMPIATLLPTELASVFWNRLFAVISHIPLMRIEAGQLKMDAVGPYTITDPEKPGRVLAIMDPEDTLGDAERERAFIVLGRHAMGYRQAFSSERVAVYYDAMDKDWLVSHMEHMLRWVKKMLVWAIVLLAPLFLLTSWLFAVVAMLLFSPVTVLLVAYYKIRQLSFSDVLRLSAVALTPVLFFYSFLPPFSTTQELAYGVLFLGYLCFAVRANALGK